MCCLRVFRLFLMLFPLVDYSFVLPRCVCVCVLPICILCMSLSSFSFFLSSHVLCLVCITFKIYNLSNCFFCVKNSVCRAGPTGAAFIIPNSPSVAPWLLVIDRRLSILSGREKPWEIFSNIHLLYSTVT